MIILTAAQLRAGIAALDLAILAGVKTVVIGDETIVYQDTAQMLQAREMYASQLRSAEGSPSRERFSLAVNGDE